MYKVRAAVYIAFQNFSNWKKNPRIWLTFILAFVLAIMLSDSVVELTMTYGTSIQVFEPFIWTFGDAKSVMLIGFLLLLLFSDVPFMTEATPYWLIRCSRKIWLAGQVLYVMLATTVYVMFFLVLESVMVIQRAFPGNVWSPTAAMLGYGKIGMKVALPASVKAMEGQTPFECVAVIFSLVLLYCLFLVSILLVGSLTTHNRLGTFVVIGINLYGLLLNPVVFQKILKLSPDEIYRANLLAGWLSPLNHATYYMHNFGYDMLPSIRMSIFLFGILICLLILFAFFRLKKYNFTFVQINQK